MTDVEYERSGVVFEAADWLGTPFHHGQMLKHVGVDCARLLVGVYTAVGIVEKIGIQKYSPNWFLHENESRLEKVLERYCVKIDVPKDGDIAVFKYGRTASHAGIVSMYPQIIHADRIQGRVTVDTCNDNHTLGRRLMGFWTFKRWVIDNV